MELCVLIPNDLYLVAAGIPEELNLSINSSDNQTTTFFVYSKFKIEKDREFYIFDGDFRLGKIKKDEQLVDSLPTEIKNIISFDFTINDRRHCNWIKFLNIKTKLNSQVNLVCNYNDNKFIFKTIKSIEPNTCLHVYFDLNDLNLSTIENQTINSSTFLDNNDLHKKLINASEYTLFNNDNYQEIIKTTNLKKRKLNTDDYLDDNPHQNGINKRKKTSKLVNNIDQYFSEQSDENDEFEDDDDNLSIDSPINLVKRSESYENLNSNDVITNSNEEESNDIDLVKNGTAIINSSQSSSLANSCSNSNETIITKDKNNNLNNSNNNSNSSNQNNNGKRPHPFSYHRNKTCHNRSGNMLPCDVCGKSFDRPSLLRRHLRTHTGEKPHVCDICSKGFSTSSSLNTHRRIHTGEKPHVCPQCKKSFTASSNLYYHRMTHQRDKPHRCGLCDKSFPTPGDLKSHSYIHNGNWPFKCRQCGKGFSKANCLSTHEFLHTGEKPHVCEVCSKAFALESNLRAHYKTHQNNLLQVNSKKPVSVNYKNSAINNNQTISSPSTTILPSVSLSNLNNLNSSIAALIQQQQQQTKTDKKSKLNNLLNSNNNNNNNDNLLSTLTNLDSFKQLLTNQNTELNKESNSNGVNNMLINNYSNLFSSILNNNSTNLINQQSQTNQLMPSILQNLNSINNLNSLNQLPLTPIDSPTTCQSSPNIPWLNTSSSNKKQNQLNLDILKDKDSSKNHLNTLMTNNLIPQICQNNNNGQQTDNLQQLILMATTAQLLSLKYK